MSNNDQSDPVSRGRALDAGTSAVVRESEAETGRVLGVEELKNLDESVFRVVVFPSHGIIVHPGGEMVLFDAYCAVARSHDALRAERDALAREVAALREKVATYEAMASAEVRR